MDYAVSSVFCASGIPIPSPHSMMCCLSILTEFIHKNGRVPCIALIAGMLLFSSSCGPSYTRAKYETNSYEWEEPQTLSKKEETLVFRIDTFFRHKVKASGLNGSVLVANEGKVTGYLKSQEHCP